jgi:hypothetical protein
VALLRAGHPEKAVMRVPFWHSVCDVNYATFQLRQPVGVVGKSTQVLFAQACYDFPFSNYAGLSQHN